MAKLDIDPASWPEFDRLLDEALDLPAERREAWLESLTAPHDRLRPQLRDLLSRAAQVETGDFLHTIPAVEAATAPTASGRPGEIVGAYRLVRELGAGGMGAVWLAERLDGLIQRPVALKLPHRVASASAGLAERLAREREILATLDHRNIARLLDAGVTASGQPFLALEFVEGVPLDRFCAGSEGGEPPGLDARLRLFRQVADAVAYAHGKLILHRDLKPANILVTPGGGVKLLDFGIAKLLSDGQVAETRLTEISGRALTPDYASPEQVLGQPLTVASDVYSLGVVLFELLTGARPYKLKRDSRGALEDAILAGEMPRPSAVAPAAWRKALRGDLDTIVGKALKRNPAERYATVNALAEDIARHLDHRPVLARPDSGWYRLRKFVARNRLAVGAGGVTLMAIITGAGLAAWQARAALVERDRAEAVSRFIASVFEEADPYRQMGRPMTAAELLVHARQQLGARYAADAPLRFELSTLISRSLLGLGDLNAAEEAATRTVEESLRTFGADDTRTLRARVQLAEVHAAQRDVKTLRPEVVELLPLTRAADTEPDLLIRMLKAHADLVIEESRFDEGVAPAEEAFRLARQRLGETHALTVAASTLYVEALFFGQAPRETLLAEAERALALALSVSGGREDSPRVLQVRDIQLRIIASAGNPRATVREARRLIDSARLAFGEDSLAVAHAMMNTAREFTTVGEVDTALANSKHALKVLEKFIDRNSHEYQYADATYALTLIAARQLDEALPAITAVEEQARDRVGATHWDTVSLMFQRAYVLARLGRAKEAQAVLDEAATAGIPDRHRDWALRMDGSVQRLNGSSARALETLTEARRLAGDKPSLPARFRVAFEMAHVLLDLRDAKGAAAELATVKQYFDQLEFAMCPVHAEYLVALGRVALLEGDEAAARASFRRAVEFWRGFDADNPGAREAGRWLARVEG